MKSYSRINPILFKQQPGEQPIRVIKAAQASKLFGGTAAAPPTTPTPPASSTRSRKSG